MVPKLLKKLIGKSLPVTRKTFSSLLVLFLLIVFSACTRFNFSGRSPSAVTAAKVTYSLPHPKAWSNTHVTFYLQAKKSITGTDQDCFRCHGDSKGQATPLNVSCATQCHSPSKLGQSREVSPITISVPTKGSGHMPLSASISGHVTNVDPPPNSITTTSCTKCHASVVTPDMKFVHFPASEGMCTLCHDVSAQHEAGQDKKGVTTKGAEDSCFQCHTKNDDKAHVHPALFMGDPSCVNCHSPHGSNQQFYIRQESIKELCITCHEPHQGKSVHGAEKLDKNCVNCHNPHSSAEEKLLNQPPDDLCLSCHNKEIPTQFATPPRVIPNIAKKIREMPHQHTAVLMGCLSCHSPHASANDRLLILNFSTSNYNTFNPTPAKGESYELCFMCHDRGMLENRKFDTAFRSEKMVGDKIVKKNLHWFHVVDASGYADKSRGRSCRICHDPHGSDQELHINDSWQMGKMMIPIVFQKTDDGGTCTKTCHESRTYKRLK